MAVYGSKKDKAEAKAAGADAATELPPDNATLVTSNDERAKVLDAQIGLLKTIIGRHMSGADARHLRECVSNIATLSAELGTEAADPVIASILTR